MTEDELFEELRYAASEQFAKLLVWANGMATNVPGRQGAEDILARIVCDNLGVLIGMAAVHPEMMAESICARLKATDWNAIKTRHFGYKLGVAQDPEVMAPAPAAENVVNIGPSKTKG